MRSLLLVVLFSAAVGAGAGTWLALLDVGEVTNDFMPSADLAAGPVISDAEPLAGAPSVREAPAPRVKVDDAAYDFGTMARGATETHQFVFTNVGTEPLRLEVGATSCKCTLGNVETGEIMPGESSPVRLEWVAKVNPGPFRQTATVLTNDPRQPRVELSVEGQVTEVTGMQPREFLLGVLGSGDAASASIYLGAYKDEPLEVSAQMAPGSRNPERFQVNVTPVEPATAPIDGATAVVRIDVKAGPGLPLGGMTEWVEIKTSLAKAPLLQAPILAVVQGDISLHGRGWSKEAGVLNLGTISAAEGKEAQLLVSFKGEHASGATAEVVEVDPPWLIAELGEPKRLSDTKTHLPLTIRVPTGQKPVLRNDTAQSDGDARVLLRTNHPETPEVDVRVRFILTQ
ncbi:DUF1573 domain-containing protein [Botrimarina hoheduenensis]|uniref:DUF1573 domain-containing protein n=1 Tax=Botrimarina hoheduenensis TaxID=2528000 RepID=A0A5C5VV30_9BACT|nr:DUF1573 domain-containing protein [Botrimarina hoheduenensis]TWT42496.1 hypothetical protein Pla111_28010 [Botrimarina hoheduenensis]